MEDYNPNILKEYHGRIPACGVYCGGCPIYTREKNPCPGADLNRQRCEKCKTFHLCCKEKGISYCYECNGFPCRKFKDFTKRWLKYGQSFIQNQNLLKEAGAKGFLNYYNSLTTSQNMKTLEESIAIAMDSSHDTAIVPFLPYILQDFWEIGTPPETIISLVRKHCNDVSTLRVLDLGCGKGAVSVRLAEATGCRCRGIDGIPEFIETARQKAQEYGVESLCQFETGDIREKINTLGGYDVIILGAIGQVFGDYHTTLTILSRHLSPRGIIIINDAYIEDKSTYRHPAVLPYREVVQQIGQAGMTLIDECKESANAYAEEFDNLQKRCRELIARYPEKAAMFEGFIQAQADEYNALEGDIVGSIMVVKGRKE